MIYHTFLILTNQTTWEHSRQDSLDFIRYYPKGYLPFSKGVIKNIELIFCHGERTRYRTIRMVLNGGITRKIGNLKACQIKWNYNDIKKKNTNDFVISMNMKSKRFFINLHQIILIYNREWELPSLEEVKNTEYFNWCDNKYWSCC